MVYLWGSRWRWNAFPVSRQGGLGAFCPEMHLCCYTNTGTKYPSTLTIEMQTIFKQVGLFIKCPVNIKEMKSFVVGHGLQPPVDVKDLVVMQLPSTDDQDAQMTIGCTDDQDAQMTRMHR